MTYTRTHVLHAMCEIYIRNTCHATRYGVRLALVGGHQAARQPSRKSPTLDLIFAPQNKVREGTLAKNRMYLVRKNEFMHLCYMVDYTVLNNR